MQGKHGENGNQMFKISLESSGTPDSFVRLVDAFAVPIPDRLEHKAHCLDQKGDSLWKKIIPFNASC
jgi:hypothetical protein